MVKRYVRCPSCYWRITRTDHGGDEHAIELHRMSGNCRAAVVTKERKPRERPDNGLDLNFKLGDF